MIFGKGTRHTIYKVQQFTIQILLQLCRTTDQNKAGIASLFIQIYDFSSKIQIIPAIIRFLWHYHSLSCREIVSQHHITKDWKRTWFNIYNFFIACILLYWRHCLTGIWCCLLHNFIIIIPFPSLKGLLVRWPSKN